METKHKSFPGAYEWIYSSQALTWKREGVVVLIMKKVINVDMICPFHKKETFNMVNTNKTNKNL